MQVYIVIKISTKNIFYSMCCEGCSHFCLSKGPHRSPHTLQREKNDDDDDDDDDNNNDNYDNDIIIIIIMQMLMI